MAAVYTNVEAVTHKGVAIDNVKSVTVAEEINLLESQSDGARGPEAVGELANTFTITIEAEETAQDLSAVLGFANKGSFIFRASLDSAPGTVKEYTINDVILTGQSRSTDQANPNGMTVTGRQAGNDSALSIATPT